MKNMSKEVKINYTTDNTIQIEWYYNDDWGWTGISRIVKELPVPAWSDKHAIADQLLILALKDEKHAPVWGFELNKEDEDLLEAFGY